MTWLPPLAVSAYLLGYVAFARTLAAPSSQVLGHAMTRGGAAILALIWPALGAVCLGAAALWYTSVGLVTAARFAGRHAGGYLFGGLEARPAIRPGRPYVNPVPCPCTSRACAICEREQRS